MLELKDLFVLLPKSIKIEFIKEKMDKLYLRENEAIKHAKATKAEFIDLSFYLKNQETYENSNGFYRLFELLDEYKNLIEMIKLSNLSDDEINELYIHNKQKRTELELEDSLFNVNTEFINTDEKEKIMIKQLNKKFNDQMNI